MKYPLQPNAGGTTRRLSCNYHCSHRNADSHADCDSHCRLRLTLLFRVRIAVRSANSHVHCGSNCGFACGLRFAPASTTRRRSTYDSVAHRIGHIGDDRGRSSVYNHTLLFLSQHELLPLGTVQHGHAGLLYGQQRSVWGRVGAREPQGPV